MFEDLYGFVCVELKDVEIPAIGHTYNSVVTEPTCTENGYTTYTCSRCDDAYIDDEVVALGHDYKSVVTAPTCTEKGYTTHTCSRCDDTYTDSETEALGHMPGAEADCLSDQICTVCGVVLKEKLGHDYVAAMTDPTCTENGYTTYTCSRCDDTYTDSEIEALGHTPRAEADCINDQNCSVCGVVLAEKLGHDYKAVVTDPTCTEQGYTTYTCSRCDASYTDSETEAVGHTPGEWIVDQEPAPGVEGSRHTECTACGETLETDVIEALPVETDADTDSETETDKVTEGPADAQDPAVSDPNGTEQNPKKGCSGVVLADVVCVMMLAVACAMIAFKRKEESC